MRPIPEDATVVVKAGVEKAAKEFTVRIESLGFTRTKKMLWIRRHSHTADFISLFRDGSSYGARPRNYSVSLTVQFGIRVLNDVFDELSPNGPRYDYSERLRAAQYHFRFNAQTGSTYERCIDDLVRYVVNEGEPWFARFREIEALLTLQDSPLRESERESLRMAVTGQSDVAALDTSLKKLGIKMRRK